MKTIGLHPHTCKQCGKRFECRDEYVFKMVEPRRQHYYHWFCSWRCLRAYETEHEKQPKMTQKQKDILDLLNAGCTVSATAEKSGASYAYVSYVKTKWIKAG